ncbi:uracil-DNA glycosylase [Asticcacaulis sp. AC466]|uniref:uracil-DNA glycosylase n=1 Tax=Asticcacaulis sp. AC466 TaxID=1282362 RepID=UPI0004CF70BE|nr:uracil-DNA glycosylase [Asticcacaulis sp. AC466]
MIPSDDLRLEIESYLGFLIDHDLEDAYEAEPINRTLSENKHAFKRAVAAPAQIPVTPVQAGHNVSQLRPQSLAHIELGTMLQEARQRAGAARTLDELYAELDAFQHMPLRHEGGKGIVKVRGNPTPELLVIGECPDAEEDAAGTAFAGKAGDMMDKALKAAGVFEKSLLSGCVFWRPAGGRPLTAEDVSLNAPFVQALIRLSAPKAILLLGASAVSCVLNMDQSLAKLRGQILSHGDTPKIPVMTSYPPNFLLRQPHAKGLFWKDLLTLVVKSGL